jgi:predicted dehydrogenase
MSDDRTAPPIRLGIIGTGLAVEQLHWPALRRLTDRFRVVAFCDTERTHAERFAAYSGASLDNYVADYRALLARADVDAVLISLPIPLNYAVTREAVAAGKHVVCEKPAGANWAEGRAFVELAAAHPELTILVAENWFYRDDLRLARALLDEGTIGRLHLVAWRSVSQLVPRPGEFSSTAWRHRGEYEGGPHLDAGVHWIAQLRLLCGDVTRVAGEIQDANAVFGGPSDLTLNLRFVSGAVGNYTASYPELAVPPETNELRLYGDEAVMTLQRNEIQIHRPDETVETHRLASADGGYYNEFLNFADAVAGKAPLLGTAVQSYRNLELIAAGLDSARTGRIIAVEPWPEPLSANAVPLWRPVGATGLFDGLPCSVTRDVQRAGS